MKGQVVKWQSDENLPKLLITLTVAWTRVVAGSIACYSDNKRPLFARNYKVKFQLDESLYCSLPFLYLDPSFFAKEQLLKVCS